MFSWVHKFLIVGVVLLINYYYPIFQPQSSLHVKLLDWSAFFSNLGQLYLCYARNHSRINFSNTYWVILNCFFKNMLTIPFSYKTQSFFSEPPAVLRVYSIDFSTHAWSFYTLPLMHVFATWRHHLEALGFFQGLFNRLQLCIRRLRFHKRGSFCCLAVA